MRHSARRKSRRKQFQLYREHKQRKAAKRAKAVMVNRGRQLKRSPAHYHAVRAVGFVARNIMWINTTSLTPIQPSVVDIAEKISKKQGGKNAVPPKPKQVGPEIAAA